MLIQKHQRFHLCILSSSLNSRYHPLNNSSSKAMAACVDHSRSKFCCSDQSPKENSLYNNYVKFSRPNFSSYVSSTCSSITTTTTTQPPDHHKKPIHFHVVESDTTDDDLWLKMRDEAQSDIKQEPILLNYYFNSILYYSSLEGSLANHLAMKLSTSSLPTNVLTEIFLTVFNEDPGIRRAIQYDLKAVKERDPACISYIQCMLNFKGFLACEAHRVAHKLWTQGRHVLALLIQNRVSEVFAVDIHPGAKIGHGILFDHATGIVIGETAVIGNNVSILHNVTLGGTGKVCGDRHPKIGDGVLIGACTSILGNVRIGEGAKIGAGSVVLKDVPPRTTAVGNPARLIGGKENPIKCTKIPGLTMDHTSFISEWSDYVI